MRSVILPATHTHQVAATLSPALPGPRVAVACGISTCRGRKILSGVRVKVMDHSEEESTRGRNSFSRGNASGTVPHASASASACGRGGANVKRKAGIDNGQAGSARTSKVGRHLAESVTRERVFGVTADVILREERDDSNMWPNGKAKGRPFGFIKNKVPAKLRPKLAEANLLYLENKLDEALVATQNLLHDCGARSSYEAWLLLANIYKDMGKLRLMINAELMAADLRWGDPDLWATVAQQASTHGMYKEAWDALKGMISASTAGQDQLGHGHRMRAELYVTVPIIYLERTFETNSNASTAAMKSAQYALQREPYSVECAYFLLRADKGIKKPDAKASNESSKWLATLHTALSIVAESVTEMNPGSDLFYSAVELQLELALILGLHMIKERMFTQGTLHLTSQTHILSVRSRAASAQALPGPLFELKAEALRVATSICRSCQVLDSTDALRKMSCLAQSMLTRLESLERDGTVSVLDVRVRFLHNLLLLVAATLCARSDELEGLAELAHRLRETVHCAAYTEPSLLDVGRSPDERNHLQGLPACEAAHFRPLVALITITQYFYRQVSDVTCKDAVAVLLEYVEGCSPQSGTSSELTQSIQTLLSGLASAENESAIRKLLRHVMQNDFFRIVAEADALLPFSRISILDPSCSLLDAEIVSLCQTVANDMLANIMGIARGEVSVFSSANRDGADGSLRGLSENGIKVIELLFLSPFVQACKISAYECVAQQVAALSDPKVGLPSQCAQKGVVMPVVIDRVVYELWTRMGPRSFLELVRWYLVQAEPEVQQRLLAWKDGEEVAAPLRNISARVFALPSPLLAWLLSFAKCAELMLLREDFSSALKSLRDMRGYSAALFPYQAVLLGATTMYLFGSNEGTFDRRFGLHVVQALMAYLDIISSIEKPLGSFPCNVSDRRFLFETGGRAKPNRVASFVLGQVKMLRRHLAEAETIWDALAEDLESEPLVHFFASVCSFALVSADRVTNRNASILRGMRALDRYEEQRQKRHQGGETGGPSLLEKEIEILYNRGRAFQAAGRNDLASHMYMKAMELDISQETCLKQDLRRECAYNLLAISQTNGDGEMSDQLASCLESHLAL
ncbi:General transcription factor 3C polypeptide 3 [Porphyridium purpureum]|uniref:General transcription factor 3C polypeptide 3 n=1 Tax=Porphyridium purpureum TaxID=35688 RepID=A0A5J4YWI3_PORPP|nr:General transcription factor 3C polypeptide 3 [Porphyridium purpureum]|eukprot:POR5289..scf209_3